MPEVNGFEKINALPPVKKSEEQPMAVVDTESEELQNLLKNIEG